jgi:hypothetical protein
LFSVILDIYLDKNKQQFHDKLNLWWKIIW